MKNINIYRKLKRKIYVSMKNKRYVKLLALEQKNKRKQARKKAINDFFKNTPLKLKLMLKEIKIRLKSKVQSFFHTTFGLTYSEKIRRKHYVELFKFIYKRDELDA